MGAKRVEVWSGVLGSAAPAHAGALSREALGGNG
jgi:hypothetical protein